MTETETEPDNLIALLAAIVDSSDDAIISKRLDGRVTSWNAGATRLFGYEPAEMIGQSIKTIIPPELQSEEVEIIRQLRAGQRVDHFETERLTKSGGRVEVSITVSPVRNEAGVITGASKVARDIGTRKRMERQLREADQRKDEFLAMLGHELRNPLAPIRNITELLRRTAGGDPDREEMYQVLDRQVRHMTRLLDDLLDVTRIRQGKITLHREAVDVLTVVARAIETARPLLDERHHKLRVNLPPEDLRLFGDSTRLVQMLGNLLNNAAKYTPPGGEVAVSATRSAGFVSIHVRDNGAGIPANVQPIVFDLFVQAERTLDRSQGGLGIGLTLVRTIAELHGGRVAVKSAGAGQGSEFTVTLPVMAVDEHPAIIDSATGLRPSVTPRRILVVDDNVDAAESLAILLRLSGHDVVTASSGGGALECAGSRPLDLVLLDIGLPDIHGYEVAKRLRRQGYRALLAALTGYGQPDDRHRALQAGFDHHFVKPVDPHVLEGILREQGAGRG